MVLSPERLIVITAPSGAGKTTLIQMLMKNDPDLVFSVSHTTRAPRPGETDGVQYHFIDRPGFDRMVAEDAFLEWADVHGNRYGTSRAEIARLQATGKRVILDIDVQGSLRLQSFLKALYIFIGVESPEVLRERLVGRATDAPDVIARRVTNAQAELAAGQSWPHVVVNRVLEDAYAQLKTLIYGPAGQPIPNH